MCFPFALVGLFLSPRLSVEHVEFEVELTGLGALSDAQTTASVQSEVYGLNS